MSELLEKATAFLEPNIAKWDFSGRPLVVGISGPQGSGKSYLSSRLYKYLEEKHPELNTIIISVDDLYLTYDEQTKLTNKTANPLLKGRGLPGTQDVPTTYTKLAKLINRDTNFSIPKYDKSAYNGLGDRDVESEWTHIGETPVDIVIYEGWFVGFTSITDEEHFAAKIASSPLLQSYKREYLEEVNSNLDEFLKIWRFIDVGILYDTENIHNVFEWRTQQEHDLIAKKGSGMTDEQVHKFVERYMAFYELYYNDFVENGFDEVLQTLKIKIDPNRKILGTSISN